MNQSQLDRAVARATGESLRTVNARGFGLVAHDFKERQPLVNNWDESNSRRGTVSDFPQSARQTAGA